MGRGGSHTCHLASPAEAPSSAKWRGHKMAAVRQARGKMAAWEVYGNRVGGGGGESKEGGCIKSYRPPPSQPLA